MSDTGLHRPLETPITDMFEDVGVKFSVGPYSSGIACAYWTAKTALEAIRAPRVVQPELGPLAHGMAGPRPPSDPCGSSRTASTHVHGKDTKNHTNTKASTVAFDAAFSVR